MSARGATGAARLAAACAACAVCASAAAYTTEDLKRDARAQHAKMMAALGGVRLSQTVHFAAPGAGQAGSSQELWLKGEKWRSEGVMTGGAGAMQSTTLFDGKDLWTVTMGMKVRLPGAQAQAPLTSAWSSLPEGTQIVGSDTVGGRPCWMLQHPELPANPVLRRGTGRTRLCIDKKHFMLLMTESVLSGRTIRTTMSDFRSVKGYEFPHETTTTSNGATTMTSKVTRLEVGAALPDELFDAGKLAGAPAGGGSGAAPRFDVEAQMRQVEEMRRRMGAASSPGK